MRQKFSRRTKFFSSKGKIPAASKCAKHETGIEHVQRKLENFFGSRGSFVLAINFSRAAQVVRGGSDGRDVEFFLFLVDGRQIGSRSVFARAASQKNYAGRFAPSAGHGLRDLGGGRAHFHRTFFGHGNFLRRILFDGALCPGSLGSQTKVLIVLKKFFCTRQRRR